MSTRWEPGGGQGRGDNAALHGGCSLPAIAEQEREAGTVATRITSFDHGFLRALYSRPSEMKQSNFRILIHFRSWL